MLDEQTNNNSRKVFYIVSLISILLFILISILVLRYIRNISTNFRSPNDPIARVDTGEPADASKDKIDEIVDITNDSEGISTMINPEPENIDSQGISSINEKLIKPIPTNPVVQNPKIQTSKNQLKPWVPNNYKLGDIKGDSYKVIQGDTLWEISEGRYGIGANWIQIAKINPIKYSETKRPLIYIGDLLKLPN